MKLFKIGLLAAIIFTNGLSVANARTWHVELDGSGDFDDIQPAVDASAAGDTIRIGPGRFDTFRLCVSPVWTEETIVSVTKDNLAFIGSGKDITIVGTEAFYGAPGEDPKGFCSIDSYDGVIQDLTIENVETGIYWYRGNLRVENCVVRGNHPDYGGTAFWLDGGLIKNCDFLGGGRGIGCAVLSTSQDVAVQDCSFLGFSFGLVAINGSQNTTVSGCDFEGSHTGIQFSQQATGSVTNTTLTNISLWALQATNNSDVIVDCVFINGAESGIVVGSGSVFSGINTVVENTTAKGLLAYAEARVTLNNSHILPASGLGVKCDAYFEDHVTLDLTANYWGTTDPESIAAMILDSNDDPNIHCTVNFLPIAEGPVPTENTSWGSVKSMFR